MTNLTGESQIVAPTSRLKSAAAVARAALDAALDLLLPRLCAACRQPVVGPALCPACWSRLSFISRPYCERLGIPFQYDPGPGVLSMEAIAIRPRDERQLRPAGRTKAAALDRLAANRAQRRQRHIERGAAKPSRRFD